MKTIASLIALAGMAAASLAADTFSWRYYRPTNTGIQGDSCEAVYVGPDGNPWFSGYTEVFEEGGISKFIVGENRWVNVSNVDYPIIGHPDFTAITRISDIDIDASGAMWMSTGRGALYYNPAVGPSSLKRYGADNSGIYGGWNKGVEVAPDGTVWFSSYSTVWGGGGIARYNPTTNVWQTFESYGGGPLAIQPKPGGGYYVWTMLDIESARYDSTTGTWTTLPKADGNPAYIIGKNLTDSAGNTWMYRWTNATMNEYRIDLRRPDGTWVGIPVAPFDGPFNSAAGIRAISPSNVFVVDGGGEVFHFNGTSWTSLGHWQNTTYSYDIDVDAQNNVWVVGSGGAGRRDAVTGQWQRYRVTNTSQYDFFNNDLTVDAAGTVFAAANAASGIGGMVKFDGQRWTGINNLHYGLGVDFPFPCDNSSKVYLRPSNGELIVNPMFNYLHSFDGSSFTDLMVGNDSVNDSVEDSLGRLWTTYYGKLLLRTGSTWTEVSNIGANKLRRDPNLPGTIWAMGETTIMRTDGTTFFTREITNFPELSPQSDQFKGFAVSADGIVWLGANTINLPDNSALIRLNPKNGTYTSYRYVNGWPFPGQYLMPLAATPDGRIWMQYDSDYLVAQRGLCWFDGTNVGTFPAPSGGEPQWGGLPHAGIADLEVRPIASGYELWMSCLSRGIAVLTVTNEPRLRLLLQSSNVVGGNQLSGTVILAAAATGGQALVRMTDNSPSILMSTYCVVPQGQTQGAFNIWTYGVSASTNGTITASYNGSQATATLTLTPATLDLLWLTPTSVVGGNPSMGNLRLTGMAPLGGKVATLASSNTAVAAMAPSTTISYGASKKQFPVSTFGVDAIFDVTISATVDGITRDAVLRVRPATLSAVTLSSPTVVGGSSVTGTIAMTGKTGPAGRTVVVSSNNAAATVPGTVYVPPQRSSWNFTVQTSVVGTNTTATLLASQGGQTRTATLLITP